MPDVLPLPARADLTLLTLGDIAFQGRGARTAARTILREPTPVAVLGFLMVTGRTGYVDLDELVAMFWPGSGSSRGEHSLGRTLSLFEEGLGPDVILKRGASELRVDPTRLECDAARLENLLDSGQQEEALELYRGDLLPGLHVSGAPDFGEWLTERRSHLQLRAAKAAWDLATEHEHRGEATEAAFWGKRALALSPFSESEVQRLLHLLSRIGDWAGALRAYHGLEGYLQREFGAAPSVETARVMEGMRRHFEAELETHSLPFGVSRRAGERRGRERRGEPSGEWVGPERRSDNRRTGDRRSGEDRRGPLRPRGGPGSPDRA